MDTIPINVAEDQSPKPLARDDRVLLLARRLSATFLTGYLCWHFSAGDWKSVFQYHTMAMTLAFISAMPETVHAALTVRRARTMTDRNALTKRHFIISTFAGALVVVGYIAIFWSKSSRGKQHLKTWHGLIGFCLVSLVALQTIAGVAVYFRLTNDGNKIAAMKKIHKYAGIVIVAAGAVSMWLGFQSKYALKTFTDAAVRLILGLICAAFPIIAYACE